MDFEPTPPTWDIIGVLSLYAIWIALICACWASQLLPLTKQLFSYGKLCQATDQTESKQTSWMCAVTHNRLYTSHAAGFSWYYKIASVVSCCALLELLFTIHTYASGQPLNAYFPVYHASVGDPTIQCLSYILFPLHHLFSWCVEDNTLAQTRPERQVTLDIYTQKTDYGAYLPSSPTESPYSPVFHVSLASALEYVSANLTPALESQISDSQHHVAPSQASTPLVTSSLASRVSLPPFVWDVVRVSVAELGLIARGVRDRMIDGIERRTNANLKSTRISGENTDTDPVIQIDGDNANIDWDAYTVKLASDILATIRACVCLTLVAAHCVRRLYETVYVHVSDEAQTKEQVPEDKAKSTSGSSRNTSKQHILVTVCGIIYYLLVILTPALCAVLHLSNLAHNNPHMSQNHMENNLISMITLHPFDSMVFVVFYAPISSSSLFFCGILVFLYGSTKQMDAHAHLAALRRKPAISTNVVATPATHTENATDQVSEANTSLGRENEASEGKMQEMKSNRYKIPVEGWFEYVSCPHYLAEVILYVGLAMVMPSFALFGDIPARLSLIVTKYAHNIPGILQLGKISILADFLRLSSEFIALCVKYCNPMWLCVVWVASNLYITAQGTHQWYQRTFPHYPRQRNAMFPSVRRIFQ